VLALGFVAALMSSGQFAAAEERLHQLEHHLPDVGVAGREGEPLPLPHGMVVIDQDQWDRLPAALELYRSALSLIHGDLDAAIAHADLATFRAADDDHLNRAGAAATAGLARWAGGKLEEAHRSYTASAQGLRRIGHISDVLGCSITLADIRITQGRLTDALTTYQAALRLAEDDPGPATRGIADMHVGLSQIAYERNDLAAAADHLQLSRNLGDAAGLPQNPYRKRVAEARLLAAQGDLAAAIELLDQAEQMYFGDFAPNVRPIAALRTQLQLANGDLAAAVSWARTRDLGVEDELSYRHEFEHLTVAMVLLAQHQAGDTATAVREATRLLERLLAAAEAGGRHGTCIEILIQLALAAQAGSDRTRATDLLTQALALAEREGHLRPFVNAGPALSPILRTIRSDSSAGRHARAVLTASGDAPEAGPVTSRHPLLDPLSERELDVLRLLDSDLSGPAIARELSVSVNTVRTHTQHIFAKLGVTNRREAVREAARLGLQRRSSR